VLDLTHVYHLNISGTWEGPYDKLDFAPLVNIKIN
jgi:hypothetical protein